MGKRGSGGEREREGESPATAFYPLSHSENIRSYFILARGVFGATAKRELQSP